MDYSKTAEHCKVVRGSLGGEPWGWDVFDWEDRKVAHYGTKEQAETFAEGFTLGVLAALKAVVG